MIDAASDLNQVGRNCVEVQWRTRIFLLQIWRAVLPIIFAGVLGWLDEFKREMWLLLVAAGSGYLARCWHKALRPKAELADYAHVDAEDLREELIANHSTVQPLLEAAAPNALLRRNLPASLGNELAPKPLKRSFSPKALSKKLFSSDANKGGKASKKDEQATSSTDESSKLVAPEVEKSPVGTGAQISKKSPWSSFRSKKSPSSKDAFSEDDSGESLGCLIRPGDSFRKSRERRRSDNGSSSSRSLQAFFLGESESRSPSVGSSRREVDVPDSIYSPTELPVTPLSGGFVADAASERSEVPGSGKLPEVASSQLRPKAVENEAKLTLSSSPERPGGKNLRGSAIVVHNNGSSRRRDAPSSVSEVVARIEKGNLSTKVETVAAVHSLRGANPATAQRAALNDAGKVRTPKLESIDQKFVEESEVLPGGKGKRRADVGKVAVDGDGKALPALLTGKRTKDSKNSNKVIPRESGGVTLTSITCKRMKDVAERSKEDAGESDEASPSSTIGTVDLSQVFFGFDSSFMGSPTEEKSPFKYCKRSRYMSRPRSKGTMRRMRESPRPVSALESCLRAQFPLREEGTRVARSLNFSTLVSDRDKRRESLGPDAENPFLNGDLSSPRSVTDRRALGRSELEDPQTAGALGLPVLKTPPRTASARRGGGEVNERGRRGPDSASKYQRKAALEGRRTALSSQSTIRDVVWRPTTMPVPLKKRKVSQACSPSATSINIKATGYELEALVIPPMEGLLFSFGVGIGVMSLINEPEGEIQRLNRQLQKSEDEIENLNNMLRQARDSLVEASGPLSEQEMVAGSTAPAGVTGEVSGNNAPLLDKLSSEPAIDETGKDVFDIYRREAPETPQGIEHMAILEAELEAELDALTGGICDDSNSCPPNFAELDPEGVAGVADRDLVVEGLPSLLDWDDDNDDFITEEPPQSGGGVPPRELSRLLRKVQSSREEHLIAELQADLRETVEKMQMMERELQCLREKTSSSPPAAGKGIEAKGLDSAAEDLTNDLGHSDDSLFSAQIELLEHCVFEEEEYYPDENFKSGTVTNVVQGTMKPKDEPSSPVAPARHEPRSGLQGSVASGLGPTLLRSVTSERPSLQGWATRELLPSPQRSLSGELGSNLLGSVARDAGSSVRRSAASLLLAEKSMDCLAKATNDAACDTTIKAIKKQQFK